MTPQLIGGLVAMILVGGLGFDGKIPGDVSVSAILSLAAGFGLGVTHEANGGA